MVGEVPALHAELYPETPTLSSRPHGDRDRRPRRGRQVDRGAGVADALGFTYLDSGAMYRSRRARRDPARGRRPRRRATRWASSRQASRSRSTAAGCELDGEDVSEAIRDARGHAAASRVSVHPQVREAMVERQRALIDARRLRRRGPRHRHRRQPRRAAQGLPHGQRRTSAPAGAPPRPASTRAEVLAAQARARRARPRARARRPARRRRRGRARHDRASDRRGRRADRRPRARAEPVACVRPPACPRSRSSASRTSASRRSSTGSPAAARPSSTRRRG